MVPQFVSVGRSPSLPHPSRKSGAAPATHSAVIAARSIRSPASVSCRCELAADSGGCVRKFAPCRIPGAASAP
eukprot:8955770-Pyramimonas_sp.AAC.1